MVVWLKAVAEMDEMKCTIQRPVRQSLSGCSHFWFIGLEDNAGHLIHWPRWQ